MPTATPFTALGSGNGFPFCMDRAHVDGYDYWTTLSGFKKTNTGNPTQAQIGESLQIASRLWWNSYQWAGNVRWRGESITSATFSLNSDGVEIEPMDRVCVPSDSSIGSISANADMSSGIDIYSLAVRNDLRPIALLRGGELMGYSITLTSGEAYDPNFSAYVAVQLSGYANNSGASEVDYDVGYLDITLGSLNFTVVSNCRAISINTQPGDVTVTASSAFAEIDLPYGNVSVNLLANGGPYSFYTYP